jgi:hypothetical protein
MLSKEGWLPRELLEKLAALSKDNRALIVRLAARWAPTAHVCNRKGPTQRVIDESADPHVTCIYPTCSHCGKPQSTRDGVPRS